MEKLHIRKPNIYKDNICKVCNKDIDKDLHPFVCGINNIHLRNKFATLLNARMYGKSRRQQTN